MPTAILTDRKIDSLKPGEEIVEWWDMKVPGFGIPGFTPQDLRRTCSTKLGEMLVPGHLIDRITNHKPAGITDRVYNKYDYLKEKREALNALGARLVPIVSDLEIVKAETAKT